MKLSTAMVYMGGSAALLSSQGGWKGVDACACGDPCSGDCCIMCGCPHQPSCTGGGGTDDGMPFIDDVIPLEMLGQDPRINFYQQVRNAGAHSAAEEEEVPICANLNITSSYTCVSYCNDNGYGNGTASWDIQGNINGTDTSCVCYSTEGLTETVCTTAGNVPVMAPAPVGSIPSCLSLNITSSDECEHACYPEGGLITGVSFSNGFCQCVGVFDNMPSFILCEDATPTASPTSNADVTSSLIAGCFVLFATIMHIL